MRGAHRSNQALHRTGKATMLRQLRIRNFRLFDDLRIAGLERINLLGGRNNAGKTSVLEAVFLLSGGGNPHLAFRLNAFRGLDLARGSPDVVAATHWKTLFANLEIDGAITVSGVHTEHDRLVLDVLPPTRSGTIPLPQAVATNGGVGVREGPPPGAGRTDGEPMSPLELRCLYRRGGESTDAHLRLTSEGLELSVPKPLVSFRGVFLSSRSGSPQEDAGRWAQLRQRKMGHLLTEALRNVEPRLRAVEELSASGAPMIWADMGLSEMLPLPALGEGMTRLARIVLGITAARHGVVLIDEIENGFHHSALGKVWTVVDETARRFEAQVFATTHSFECLSAAHAALDGGWRYHRLERSGDGETSCVTFNAEDVEVAVHRGLEVR